MLLIAQPKSASSSLVKTLAKVTGGYGHVSMKKEPGAVYLHRYSELNKYHTTTCLRPKEKLRAWSEDRKNFWKEHILPDDENVKYIREKYVVLLRRIEDSVDSYRRFGEKHMINVNLDKIERNLKSYQKGWLEKKSSKILVIWYDDLILDYKKVMKKILNHYGISGDIPELGKVMYTGVGRKRILTKQPETDIINHD